MNERLTGKITKINRSGWGFITSKQKEFTRIFFHWEGLNQHTLNFKDLRPGMLVEFDCIEYTNHFTGKNQGWRAIRISVQEPEVLNVVTPASP